MYGKRLIERRCTDIAEIAPLPASQRPEAVTREQLERVGMRALKDSALPIRQC